MYYCHAPLTLGWAQVGISGDLQELFDKFPTPEDSFMFQIPYILYIEISKLMEILGQMPQSWGQIMLINH